jgi:hypothetical protein
MASSLASLAFDGDEADILHEEQSNVASGMALLFWAL